MAGPEELTPDSREAVGAAAGKGPWGWRRILGALGAIFLGGVFLVAVWGKMFDPGAFAEVIELEGLTFDFHVLGLHIDLSADFLAWFALTLEAAIGFALLLQLRQLWVLVPTALLVAFFLYLTGKAYVAHLYGEAPTSASCGCFGSLWDRTPAEAFWLDALLMVPPLVFSFFGRPRGAFPWIRSGIVVVLMAAVGVFVRLAPDLPLDDFATRLHPGIAVKDICAGGGDDEICLLMLAEDKTVLLQGHRLCVIAELGDEAFIEEINNRADALWDRSDAEKPPLLVLHGGEKTDQSTFEFATGGAPLEFLIAPRSLLRTMYRTLPRTFLLEDGMVVETWTGFPPLLELEPK